MHFWRNTPNQQEDTTSLFPIQSFVNEEAIAISDLLSDGFSILQSLPDPKTDRRLLPPSHIPRDNSRQVRHYKRALRRGMDRCLTPTQREQLRLHYQAGLRKSEIAELQSCTCSAVSKSIRAGKAALESYIELYMDIYDYLEQEFLQDE